MQYQIKSMKHDNNILQPTKHEAFKSEIELPALPIDLIWNAKQLIKRTKRNMCVVTNERGDIVWLGAYNENFIESMKGEQNDTKRNPTTSTR